MRFIGLLMVVGVIGSSNSAYIGSLRCGLVFVPAPALSEDDVTRYQQEYAIVTDEIRGELRPLIAPRARRY